MLRYILVISCFLKVAINFRREEQLLQYLQPDNIDDGHYDTMGETSQYLCTRVCRQGEKPRVCYYQFTLEQYTVMGPACKGCPQNRTACYAPQCVAADGQEKMLLTVNRMLPGPSIQVCKGDTLIIDVANKLPGRSASIHWHGIRQVGTPYMDGMPMVTQCPISSSQIFRYKFKAADAGTFFWHSHDGAQKMDGILGSLIVREPREEDPNSKLYDRDQPSHAMLVMDWMHTPADDHLPGLLRSDKGQEPDSYLINGRGVYVPTVVATNLDTFKQQMQFMATGTTPTAVFVVKKGLRYRFRVIGGTCLSCPFQLFVEDHRLKLIGSDMDSLEPKTVDSVVLASGERFDFVIEANLPSSAYWVYVKGLGACAKTFGVAILRYEDTNYEKPLSPYPGLNGFPQGVVLNPRNSVCRSGNPNELCVTQVKSRYPNPDGLLKRIPDKRFVLRFGFYQYTQNELFRSREYYKFFLPYNSFTNQIPLLASYVNNITLAFPPSPLLTQLNDIPTSIFCSEQCSNESPVRCECLHILQAPLGSVIEFIIVDDAEPDAIAISHPFHIHGYEFSVMELGKFGGGDRKAQISNLIKRLESNPIRRSNILRKDTVAVPAAGYAVGRIVADNPGFWFIHCHFIYHLESGMAAILQVGEPNEFPPIPRGFPKCEEFTTPNADPL